jgi:hypothetical protein
MIRVDPAFHMEVVVNIIQNRYLAVFVFVLALGMYLPVLGTLFDIVISIFVYMFPFYLFFTLLINHKKRWVAGLVIWMGLSFIPLLLDTGISNLQGLLGLLPVLFLVLFCVVLNIRLKEWGYRSEGEFPLWF